MILKLFCVSIILTVAGSFQFIKTNSILSSKSLHVSRKSVFSKDFRKCCLKSSPNEKLQLNVKTGVPNVFSKIASDSTTARIALLCVSALYGSNFSCVKIINSSIDPSIGAFLRFSLAGLVFLPSFLSFLKSKKDKALLYGGLEVGTYCFLGYWAQANSLISASSSASSAAFICSLAVVVVPILDLFFSKTKKLNNYGFSLFSSFIPAMLALLGVASLELGGSKDIGVGDLLACLQPLFFGLSFWRIESLMSKTKNSEDTQAFTGAMLSMVAGLSMLWALCDFSFLSVDGHDFSNLLSQFEKLSSVPVFLSILWTGFVTTALTTFVENIAMKKLSAAESTIIYSTEPLWGTMFASIFLHETLGKQNQY